MSDSLFVVGPGRMGLALGQALWEADGVKELLYCGRRPDPPPHPLFTQGIARYAYGLPRPGPGTTAVVLAVPDVALPAVSVALAARGEAPRGCVVFHLSGAIGTEPLAPLLGSGYGIGTLHPFQSVADPETGAGHLPGSYFAISGDSDSLAIARRLVSALDSRAITVPVSRRPLYHASAVFASNYLSGLVAAGARLLTKVGLPQDEAIEAVVLLARGTLDNLERLGASDALTGPISRGDIDTVRLHLTTLEPREKELYVALGLEILHLAREGGLEEDVAEEIATLLERER